MSNQFEALSATALGCTRFGISNVDLIDPAMRQINLEAVAIRKATDQYVRDKHMLRQLRWGIKNLTQWSQARSEAMH